MNRRKLLARLASGALALGGRMTDYHINIFYSDEDGGYVADIPDLEGCSAFGKTSEEALAEVTKARDAWLQAAMMARLSPFLA